VAGFKIFINTIMKKQHVGYKHICSQVKEVMPIFSHPLKMIDRL